jgi:voltage-dependent potassium channel beta subunit
MHYRRLGHSGLKVSEISLGSWVTFGGQIDEDTAISLIHEAYGQGINFFDNADMYANGQAEIVLGKAIKDLPREELVISSKVFWPVGKGPNSRGLSRKHVTEAVHSSLKRLGLDYLDLYFCHRFDPDTPVEEVVRTMDDLIHQGKILYWGTSEWEAAQVMEAYGIARQYGLIPPTMEQPQYNLFHRKRVEDTLMPICRDLGLGLTTFSPLYYGILTGKYNEGIPQGSRASLDDYSWIRDRITPLNVSIVKKLTAVANDLSITPSQLAIAWILRRKEVSSVITGASRLEQLDENLGASEAYERFTETDIDRIFECLAGYQE